MNHIVIKYTYLSSKAEMTMNGEAASQYSEVSSTLNRPFWEGFLKIIPGLDNEVFDDYYLDFFGTAFQYKLLKATAAKSEYCKEIHFHEIESLFSSDDIISRLSKICEQCNAAVDKAAPLSIFSQIQLPIPQKLGAVQAGNSRADIGIFNSLEEIQPSVRIPVVISERLSIRIVRGRPVFCIPIQDMDIFWDYIDLEYRVLPSIVEYMSALKYAPLTAIQKVELNAIRNNQAQYYIGSIPNELDEGRTVKLEFVSFPQSAFRIASSNNGVFQSTESRISAVSGGTANLLVIDNKNQIVAQKKIEVVTHQYVEEIRLIPHFEYLKKNEKNKIDILVTPLHGEDVNQLVWSVSDPNVVQVDKSGNVYALSDGLVSLTVSGRFAKATLDIEVKPGLQSIRISQQSIRLKTGETMIIDCQVTPPDAPTENLTWELDNRTIASINPSKTGRRCKVTAATGYEGKGNIRCYDASSKLGAVCNIEVISKVQQGSAGKIALWCWIIGFFMPFLLPISTIAGIYGISCDPEPEHKTRYVVCTVGSILTMLFWLMLAVS